MFIWVSYLLHMLLKDLFKSCFYVMEQTLNTVSYLSQSLQNNLQELNQPLLACFPDC